MAAIRCRNPKPNENYDKHVNINKVSVCRSRHHWRQPIPNSSAASERQVRERVCHQKRVPMWGSQTHQRSLMHSYILVYSFWFFLLAVSVGFLKILHGIKLNTHCTLSLWHGLLVHAVPLVATSNTCVWMGKTAIARFRYVPTVDAKRACMRVELHSFLTPSAACLWRFGLREMTAYTQVRHTVTAAAVILAFWKMNFLFLFSAHTHADTREHISKAVLTTINTLYSVVQENGMARMRNRISCAIRFVSSQFSHFHSMYYYIRAII